MIQTGFINKNFLLHNKYSKALYHDFASNLPIIDYHNHLPPRQIAENHIFENISQVWLAGDHYKWRVMRAAGVDEKYITGTATDEEKFIAWAKVVPYTLRNPLFHWTHLELKRYFGVDQLLSEKNAAAIYKDASSQLQDEKYHTRGLLEQMNVEVICTTEDPVDNLAYHQQLKNSNFSIKVSTAFRPDRFVMIGNSEYCNYLDELSEVSGITINTYDDLCEALKKRIAYFDKNGCRLSDHGLSAIPFVPFKESEIKNIFKNKKAGKTLSNEQIEQFQTTILLFLAEEYHKYGWVQQFHLGALRNNNTRMNQLLGPDTGWDSIGDFPQAQSLSLFLNELDKKDNLTKTILYNLNPADNELFATMIGNFNDGSVRGKIQFGSGWWFLDQKDGIIKQLNALSNMGMVSYFIGMLTDSRSFLSFPRHEYFRRVLCNVFGEEIERGELPNDIEWIGKIISDICYYNAKNYFDF